MKVVLSINHISKVKATALPNQWLLLLVVLCVFADMSLASFRAPPRENNEERLIFEC